MANTTQIALIDVPARLRPVDQDWVDAIAQMMVEAGGETKGQRTPIEIRAKAGGRFDLVTGAHRYFAAKKLSWAEIKTQPFEGSDLDARIAEIDENLGRHELTALDRAVFLAERQEIYVQLHPQTAHGGDRKSKKKGEPDQVATFATRFSLDAAEKIGLSERLIQNAVRVAKSLTPEVRELARQTYLRDHGADLDLLSRLKPGEQLKAIKKLGSDQKLTLRKALDIAPAIDEQEKHFRTLVSAWARANAKTKKRFLAHAGEG